MSEAQDNVRLHYIARGAALFLLLWGLFLVFLPFLYPLAWSLILTLSIWPLYRKVSGHFPRRPNLTAGLFAGCLSVLILAVVLPILIALGGELENARDLIRDGLSRFNETVGVWVVEVPFVGDDLMSFLDTMEATTGAEFLQFAKAHSSEIVEFVSKATKNTLEFLMGIVFCGFGVFFLLRDGENLKRRLARGIAKIDSRASAMGDILVETVRGTLYGLLLTAVAQGSLAAVGYVVAGVPAPVLFGFVTALMSLVPYGTPLVYLPLSALIVAQGAPWYYGLALAVWGTIIVSSADNVLKPYFISQRVKLPLLLIFIGVLGGLFSFGTIGVFLGPVLVGIGQMLWLEWTSLEVKKARANENISIE